MQTKTTLVIVTAQRNRTSGLKEETRGAPFILHALRVNKAETWAGGVSDSNSHQSQLPAGPCS